jgi:hypothetical protein
MMGGNPRAEGAELSRSGLIVELRRMHPKTSNSKKFLSLPFVSSIQYCTEVLLNIIETKLVSC